jgi:AraC-like DNA-binding protein
LNIIFCQKPLISCYARSRRNHPPALCPAGCRLQRINRARQLLELTAMSIKEIAAEVGYENPFYFSLRFKKQTGTSPRDYRQKQIPS